MRLNHLNLTVTSVPDAQAFLEKYFGLRSMGGGSEQMAGSSMTTVCHSC